MMRAYTALPPLADSYLEDSYVIGIEACPGELRFLLDLVLTPSHPDYRPAAPGEQHCYRRAQLVFTGVTRLLWADQGSPPARDASGESDYGNVDVYEWDDAGHRLVGDWGRIEVVAAEVSVDLL